MSDVSIDWLSTTAASRAVTALATQRLDTAVSVDGRGLGDCSTTTTARQPESAESTFCSRRGVVACRLAAAQFAVTVATGNWMVPTPPPVSTLM